MPAIRNLSLFVMLSVCLPAAAQKQQQVDWEAKMLTTELHRLGDPEINMFLPELYDAIRESRMESTDSSGAKTEIGGRKRASVAPTLMSLLNNPSVRDEIGMLDYQFAEIGDKNREIQSEVNEQVLSLLFSSKNGAVNAQEVRARIQEIREYAKKEIEKAVLPYQFARLRQLAYHVQMRRQRPIDVLTSEPLATELGLTDEQQESLREEARKIEEELAREIAELRSKARDKLFARLDQTQQKKLSQIVGNDFEYRTADPRQQKTEQAKTDKEP